MIGRSGSKMDSVGALLVMLSPVRLTILCSTWRQIAHNSVDGDIDRSTTRSGPAPGEGQRAGTQGAARQAPDLFRLIGRRGPNLRHAGRGAQDHDRRPQG